MYREKLEHLRKVKGLTRRQWAEASGVSLDTIYAIVHPDPSDKYAPRVNTIEDICAPLGVEVWEIFYSGDQSLVALNSDLSTLREERDKLFADNAVATARVKELETLVSDLKDELLDIYRSKNKK